MFLKRENGDIGSMQRAVITNTMKTVIFFNIRCPMTMIDKIALDRQSQIR